MFYSTQILAKKGPLGLVWLAAHMDNRLKKNNVFEANIAGSVDSILNPEAPLALRLSGQLLLGVVNIYKRKLVYLFEDCTDAMSKMQQAFKPVTLTLPGDGKAAPAQITLPDDLDITQLQSMFEGLEDDFEPVDLSQGLRLTLNTKDSLYMAEEPLHIFRTPSSYRDEEFDIDGDEIERHMSLDPPEKLREAVAPTAQRLFETVIPSPSFKGDEMMPDVDMDDLDLIQAPPSAEPSSARPSDLGFGDDMTPVDMPDLNPIQDVPTPEQDDQTDSVMNGKDRATPKPAKQRARGGPKKQKIVRDVDSEGLPATQIGTTAIRKLLQDRQPILREAQLITSDEIAASIPSGRQQPGKKSNLAQPWMREPGVDSMMAPALYDLYPFAEIDSLAATHPAPARQTRQANNNTTQEDVDEEPTTPLSAQRPSASGLRGDDGVHDGYEPAVDDTGADLPFDEAPEAPDYNDMNDIPHSPPPSNARSLARGSGLSRTPASAQLRESQGGSAWKRQAEEMHQDEAEQDEYDYNAVDSFTARSQAVLRQVKSKVEGRQGSKKQRLSGAAASGVAFGELQTKGDRTEAARMFFELLVLQARKQVNLSQSEPYGEIVVAL